MKKVWLLLIFMMSIGYSFGQTCTVSCPEGQSSCTIDWVNDVTCLGATTIIVDQGVTLVFDPGQDDTWSGVEMQIFGTLKIDQSPNKFVDIAANLSIKSTGKLEIGAQLSLSCSNTISIDPGGTIAAPGGNASDKIRICGTTIINGAENCPNPPPYCTGSFPGGDINCGENGLPCPLTFFSGGVLPIELSHFDVHADGEIIRILWATIMEENFEKFIIQRSTDGITFEDIGEQPGLGYDIFDIETKYAFTDKAPLLGFNYYRLKAVDRDGSFEYFGPKAAKISGHKRLAISPNPTAGESISFRTNFNPSETDVVVIIDQLGTELLRFQASTLQNQIRLDNKLKPGVYFVKYVSSDFQEVARVFVKN